MLIILLFCIIQYDINRVKEYREFHIRLVLLIFVLVSGFAYRLGGDGINYGNEYVQYGNITDISFSYLMGFQGRMPGWVMLCTLCKSITSDYWLFKLVHAILLNLSYVLVVKRNTRYSFTALLFYFVLIYFNQNFQLLRESLAISFFFFALPSYYRGEWLKYYIYVIIAISFHEGAVFLLLLPLLKILGINKYSICLYLLSGILFISHASSILEMLMGVQLDGEVQGKIFHYTKQMDSQYDFSYWGNSVLNIFFPLLILYYYYKKKIEIVYLYPAIAGIFVYLVSLVVPIAYRLSNYFLIFNYMLIIDFIIKLISQMKLGSSLRLSISFLFISSFILFKARMYLLNYGETNIPSYVQYYPYASVFEKYEDPTRERLYNMLK